MNDPESDSRWDELTRDLAVFVSDAEAAPSLCASFDLDAYDRHSRGVENLHHRRHRRHARSRVISQIPAKRAPDAVVEHTEPRGHREEFDFDASNVVGCS